MKICIWMTKLFEQGGTKRVVTLLAGELAKEHDVTIMAYDNRFKEDREIYQLNETVKIDLVNVKSFVDRKKTPTNYYRGLLRKVNYKTGYFNKEQHAERMADAIFPKEARKKFVDYFNKKGYDIIISTARLSLFLGMIAPDLNAKTIGWAHSCYENYVEGNWSIFWHQEELLKRYIPQLDRYVVLTQYDVDAFKEKLDLDVMAIGNPRSFVSERKSDRTNKQFFVATRLVPRKGLNYLVKAFAEFCKQDDEWTLVIAGDGPQRKSLLNAVWRQNVQERVRFVGETKDVLKYYLDSSVYLMTSEFEGWGLVVIEAFETGVPVIAFDIPPMDLLITHNVDGILVHRFRVDEYAQAMLKLAHDKELRDSMGEKAIEKAKQFSVENVVAEWNDLFASLMNQDGK